MTYRNNTNMNNEPEKNVNNMGILDDNEVSKVTGGSFSEFIKRITGKNDEDVLPTDLDIMISPNVDNPGNENVFR